MRFEVADTVPREVGTNPPGGSTTPLPPARRGALVLAGLAFVAALVVGVPGALTGLVEPFDEGIRLSAASFVARGHLPYVDFAVPYGPAYGFLGAAVGLVRDELALYRLADVVLAAAAGALAVYLLALHRSHGRAALLGLVVGVFAPTQLYGPAYLLLGAGIATLCGWRDRAGGNVWARASSPRLLVAGLAFATLGWLRWELLVVLAAFTLGVVVTRRPRPWALLAALWVTAAAPYALLALLGGAQQLALSVHYALFSYPEFRGRPVRWDAPLVLLGRLDEGVSAWRGELLFVLTYHLGAIAVPLLALTALGRWLPGLRRWSPFGPDVTRLQPFLAFIALSLNFSLSTRADTGHAVNLVLPLWSALLWSPLRARRPARAAGLLVAALVALQLLAAAAAFERTRAPVQQAVALPRSAAARYDPAQADAFRALTEVYDRAAPRSLYVANRRNDLTHANLPLLYWLLEADPGAWTTQFDPGFTDQPNVQEATVDRLCAAAPHLVQWDTPRSTEHPAALRYSRYLDRFFALSYDLVHRHALFDFRAPRRGGCQRPESAAPDEVERRRRALLAAGDLIPAAVLGEWQAEALPAGEESVERRLLAELAGLYQQPLGTVVQRQLVAAHHQTLDGSAQATLSARVDLADPALTAATLLLAWDLARDDQARGLTPAQPPAALLDEALRRGPELAPIAQTLEQLS